MSQDLCTTSPVKLIHEYARRTQISADYSLEKESGPAHQKQFTMRLRLGEKEYTGTDRSIKLAQRAAAQNAFDDQQSTIMSAIKEQKISQKNKSLPPTVVLNTWAAQHHIPTKYTLIYVEQIPSTTPANTPFPRQIFYYRLLVGSELFFDDHGLSHSQARTNCANQALNYMRDHPISMAATPSVITSEAVPEKSCISLMYERAKKLGLHVKVEFQESSTVTYRIGDNYSTTAIGKTKQLAKRQAAEKMLEILPIPADKVKVKPQYKRTKQHKKFIEQKGSATYSLSHTINPITRLYQIARAKSVEIKFEELEKSPSTILFHYRVQYGDDYSAEGSDRNKKIAKRLAAQNLIAKLNPELLESIESVSFNLLPPAPSKGLLKRDDNGNRQIKEKHVHFCDDESPRVKLKSNSSPSISIKQKLITACEKLNIHVFYEEEPRTGEKNGYQTILSLSIDDRLLAQCRGVGPSLQRAENNAASNAWKNLQQLLNGSIPTPKASDNIPYRRIVVSNPTENHQ